MNKTQIKSHVLRAHKSVLKTVRLMNDLKDSDVIVSFSISPDDNGEIELKNFTAERKVSYGPEL